MSREKYFKKLFGNDFNYSGDHINKRYTNDRVKNALDRAWKLRDSEVDLYWRRTLYCWGFLIAIFGAFVAIFSNISSKVIQLQYVDTIKSFVLNDISNSDETQFFKYGCLLILALLGVIFSVAWIAINLGSKYWQVIWEDHIRLLEEEYHANLYNTLPHEYNNTFEISVTDTNLKVSILITIFWSCVYFALAYSKFSDYMLLLALLFLLIIILFFGRNLKKMLCILWEKFSQIKDKEKNRFFELSFIIPLVCIIALICRGCIILADWIFKFPQIFILLILMIISIIINFFEESDERTFIVKDRFENIYNNIDVKDDQGKSR